MNDTLTAERARELLSYDQKTGLLTWRTDRKGFRCAGKVAGSRHTCGYTVVRIDRVRYFAHRVVWLIVTGTMPPDQIDHINRIRNDNRIENLRCASHAENNQNMQMPRTLYLTGLPGTTFSKWAKRWMSNIRVDGRRVHLGYFDTPELAHAAYVAAKRLHHPFSTL